MKPYTHISNFPPTLIRFATYLSSQHIKFSLYEDYDGVRIYPINSRWFFIDDGGLTRIEKFKGNRIKFDLMPIREDILS